VNKPNTEGNELMVVCTFRITTIKLKMIFLFRSSLTTGCRVILLFLAQN